MIRMSRQDRAIPTVPISDCAVRLDMTRIYRDAYERAGAAADLLDVDSEREAAEEFDGEDEF